MALISTRRGRRLLVECSALASNATIRHEACLSQVVFLDRILLLCTSIQNLWKNRKIRPRSSILPLPNGRFLEVSELYLTISVLQGYSVKISTAQLNFSYRSKYIF